MSHRSASPRLAARLSAAVRFAAPSLVEPLEGRRLLAATGAPDPTFNGTGEVIDTAVQGAAGVVVQPSNGKTVVLTTNASGNAVLERFNVDGSLDTTFAGAGRWTLPASASGATSSLAVAAGDELVISGLSTVAKVLRDGGLDTSFNGTGVVTTPYPAQHVAVDSRGNVDVAGSFPRSVVGNTQQLVDNFGALEQYSPTGILNWSTQGAYGTYFDAVATDSSNRILVGGAVGDQGARNGGALFRYNSDGTLDTTFSPQDIGFSGGAFGDVSAIDTWKADGSVAVIGSSTDAGGSYVAVYRPNGSLYFEKPGNDVRLTDVKFQLGRVLVGGVAPLNSQATTLAYYVNRFNLDGTVDSNFGGGTASPVVPGAGVVHLATSPDYRVVAAGDESFSDATTGNIDHDLVVARYSSDGYRLPFGTDGAPPAFLGVHQAEDYDTGGEGIAFHDTDGQNLGGQYRPEGVDIEATTDGGPGYDVAYTHAGEWLAYDLYNGLAPATYDLSLRVANVGAGATFHVEIDGQNVTGTLAMPDTGGFQKYVDVVKRGIVVPANSHVLKIVFDTNSQYGYAGNVNSFTFIATTPPTNQPYNGNPFAPGQRIEAEQYDRGGEGVAYHDTDPQNLGGQFRPTEGVDIETTTDAGGGYDVGYTHAGEYLDYSTYVGGTGGLYDLTVRAANYGAGGSFHVNVDGQNVTGTIAIPNTGGFQNYTSIVTKGLRLSGGNHVVQVVFDGQSQYGFSGNLNWLQLDAEPTQGPTTPFGGTPATLPGVIQAENYDLGGEGNAYHDTEAQNLGGAYRGDGVDLESLGGGNYAVDFTHAGEWLKYTVNITGGRTYALDAKVANYGAGGAFHVEVDGQDVTGALAVPNTGSFTNYVDVTKLVTLPAGQHVLRVVWDANSQYGFSGNLDSISFT